MPDTITATLVFFPQPQHPWMAEAQAERFGPNINPIIHQLQAMPLSDNMIIASQAWGRGTDHGDLDLKIS